MAQFRGTMEGQRGEVSRLGSKKSGLDGSVNGWNIGVKVDSMHVEERDRVKGGDSMHASLTGGTNGSNENLPMVEFFIDENGDGEIRYKSKPSGPDDRLRVIEIREGLIWSGPRIVE